jgi:hypothetical protein
VLYNVGQERKRMPVKNKLTATPDPNILIKGYGALRGQLHLPSDIDWTRPIYTQVLARDKPVKSRVSEKRIPAAKRVRHKVAA